MKQLQNSVNKKFKSKEDGKTSRIQKKIIYLYIFFATIYVIFALYLAVVSAPVLVQMIKILLGRYYFKSHKENVSILFIILLNCNQDFRPQDYMIRNSTNQKIHQIKQYIFNKFNIHSKCLGRISQ